MTYRKWKNNVLNHGGQKERKKGGKEKRRKMKERKDFVDLMKCLLMSVFILLRHLSISMSFMIQDETKFVLQAFHNVMQCQNITL